MLSRSSLVTPLSALCLLAIACGGSDDSGPANGTVGAAGTTGNGGSGGTAAGGASGGKFSPSKAVFQACTLSDGVAATTPFEGLIALAAMGTSDIYALVKEAKTTTLRHYTVATGDDCTLVRDAAFVAPQVLALGSLEHLSVAGISLYGAGSFSSSVVKLLPSPSVECTSERGDDLVPVPGSPEKLYVKDGDRVNLVTLGATCTRDVVFEYPMTFGGSMALDGLGRLHLGAKLPSSIHILDPKAKQDIGGYATGPSANNGTGLSSLDALVPCGDAMCVLDGNLRRLLRYSHDGAPIDSVDLTPTLGLVYPWPTAMTRTEGGLLYLALTDKGATADAHRVVVFRSKL